MRSGSPQGLAFELQFISSNDTKQHRRSSRCSQPVNREKQTDRIDLFWRPSYSPMAASDTDARREFLDPQPIPRWVADNQGTHFPPALFLPTPPLNLTCRTPSVGNPPSPRRVAPFYGIRFLATACERKNAS